MGTGVRSSCHRFEFGTYKETERSITLQIHQVWYGSGRTSGTRSAFLDHHAAECDSYGAGDVAVAVVLPLPCALSNTAWPCLSTRRVKSCCAYPKTSAQARICADVSSALRPGMKLPRITVAREKLSLHQLAASAPLMQPEERIVRGPMQPTNRRGSSDSCRGQFDEFDNQQVMPCGGVID